MPFDADRLSERERTVLRLVVERYVQTAAPVGSKTLAETDALSISPASIRNTLASLEKAGLLGHPHTSAGRIPTPAGYRLFVDELMRPADLGAAERQMIRTGLEQLSGDPDLLGRETSRLLGRLSHLLGVVLSPKLARGTLERIDLVPLSSTRAMLVLAVKGGLVRTIIAETDAALPERGLDHVVRRLNERLAGLPLDEIRRTAAERVRDLDAEDATGAVRLVLREAPQLFADEDRRAVLGGATGLASQPEFQAPEEMRALLDLIEHDQVVVHLLESANAREVAADERAVVLIGQELSEEADGVGGDLAGYSVVTAPYERQGTRGAIGVIGPVRMDYARASALVEHVAVLLSRAG
jgi:heat-inducible transcriptional repressor